MNNTDKDRAIHKCEMAIDKMIDLQQDFPELPQYAYGRIQKILDELNSLNSMLWAIQAQDKRGKK